MKSIIVTEGTSLISIGKQGENNAVPILFKVSAWRNEYGNGGVFTLNHKRATDTISYPVTTTLTDDGVLWLVNSADNAIVGYGECELRYAIGDVIKKSVTWRTLTVKALSPIGDTPPDPYESWYESVLEASSNAQEAASQASEDRQAIENMTVSSETLEAGSEATVEKSIVEGVVNLKFGIPKGEDGKSAGEIISRDTQTNLNGILRGNGTNIDIQAVDNTPTENSNNLVSSDGVAKALKGKYSKPNNGIPKTDLAEDVKESLNKADTALQSVPDTYRTAQAQNAIDEAQNREIQGKQDKLTFDNAPTENSDNPVTSKGILNAIKAMETAIKSASDLVNYYTKSQTYTQDEIDQRISAIPKFSIKVVQTLPAADISDTTVYLVPNSSEETQNVYDEYIHTTNGWEKLGTQTVDLTGYATETWVTAQLGSYLRSTDIADWAKAATKPTYTKSEIGLGNVDNTSDLDKPISTATQTALDGKVDDVQVEGTSIVSNGVANIPKADRGRFGVIKYDVFYGTYVTSTGGILQIYPADNGNIKNADSFYKPIVPTAQHMSVFYGLAKAAGADEKDSTLPLGQYTEAAKSAISEMLNGAVTVEGTTPTINALSGVRYVCGEVATLDITLPASGIVDVTFESGSTPTVLTITPPSGVTLKWANDFDPTSLEANTTYEINIMDGIGVAVGVSA